MLPVIFSPAESSATLHFSKILLFFGCSLADENGLETAETDFSISTITSPVVDAFH